MGRRLKWEKLNEGRWIRARRLQTFSVTKLRYTSPRKDWFFRANGQRLMARMVLVSKRAWQLIVMLLIKQRGNAPGSELRTVIGNYKIKQFGQPFLKRFQSSSKLIFRNRSSPNRVPVGAICPAPADGDSLELGNLWKANFAIKQIAFALMT